MSNLILTKYHYDLFSWYKLETLVQVCSMSKWQRLVNIYQQLSLCSIKSVRNIRVVLSKDPLAFSWRISSIKWFPVLATADWRFHVCFEYWMNDHNQWSDDLILKSFFHLSILYCNEAVNTLFLYVEYFLRYNW